MKLSFYIVTDPLEKMLLKCVCFMVTRVGWYFLIDLVSVRSLTLKAFISWSLAQTFWLFFIRDRFKDFFFFYTTPGTMIVTRLLVLVNYAQCQMYWPSFSPSSVLSIRLGVNRLRVWPQHHPDHADIPTKHPPGHLLHTHPGFPHLSLCPSCQLQLHQHRHQHRHPQRHHWSAVLS